MTIQQAEICTRLALLGSINAVAKSLGITQPAVSSALSVLERELGSALFIRSKRGVILTRKGSELLPHFKKIVSTSEEILSAASLLPTDRGTLSIAGRQGFMQTVFPHLYKSLGQRFPELSVEKIISGDQSDVVDALVSGQVDLCFASSPKIKSIIAEVIYRDPVYICISRNHPLLEKEKLDKKRMEEVEFCLPTSDDRLRKPLEQLIKKFVRSPRIVLETNDYTFMAKLVSKHHIVAPVYHHMLLETELNAMMIPITLFRPNLYRDLTILYRRDDILPHIKTAKEHFTKNTAKLLSDRIVGI